MSTQPSGNSKPAQTHDSLVLSWGKRLWTAITKESIYVLGHDQFFKEFDSLHDVAQANKSTKITLLNHVALIYNHTASQGYQPHIYYKPLKEAVFNFCNKMPIAKWIGPPDQHSQSPSPTLAALPKALPLPRPPLPRPKINSPKFARMVASNSGPSKKGKAKAQILAEFVHLDLDKSEIEVTKDPKPQIIHLKPLSSTLGMDQHPTPCLLCEQRGHLCHSNPKATSTQAACFKCNHWKLKCSLAPPHGKKKGETPAHPNSDVEEVPQETAEKPSKNKGHAHRKLTQIPAGQPGQYSAATLAPEILKKLEDYELGRCQQLEKIEELSQAIAQLTAENKSTRAWFKSQLKLLWDHASKHDETVRAGMRKVGEQAGEMSQQVEKPATISSMPATTLTPQTPVIESLVRTAIAGATDIPIGEEGTVGTPKFKSGLDQNQDFRVTSRSAANLEEFRVGWVFWVGSSLYFCTYSIIHRILADGPPTIVAPLFCYPGHSTVVLGDTHCVHL
ncbi:hypothetical protein BYT27DRAFT_7217436 [Phlegmacium glaucopus]|nr:hypothetical protein BYT27DRAFT_7217436 [Phlegmacium glaucopus]